MDTELLIYLLFLAATIAGMWKTYEKGGEAGWKAIIPIYNLFVLMKIIRKPWYWALLMLIPYLGVIWSIWSTNLLSKSFGKGIGYTIGLIIFPFVFYPMLGFGNAQYQALDGNMDSNDIEPEMVDVTESVQETDESESSNEEMM